MTLRNTLPPILVLLMSIVCVHGQAQTQYDKGTPPQLAAGVSSLGSYMSTELGTVNLTNGGLNFNIPLGTVGGRGNVQLPLVLSYSSKVWSASMEVDTEREFGTEQSVAYADYDNQSSFAGASAPGWTLRAGVGMSVRFVKIKLARTILEYDVYANDGNRGMLTSYASVSQHDSVNYSTSKTTRGNPTRIGTWLNTTGSYIYVYPRYDVLGNVVSTKDARGNVTTLSFADDFGNGGNPGTPSQNPATPTYALPTLITSPPPLPGTPVHTARSQYDYSTGLLTGFRDRNNVVTKTVYSDPFNRPTSVISALGISGIESQTLMFYAPMTTPFGITLAKNDVLTASDQTAFNDRNLRLWTVTDGFGRTKEAWTRDPQGDVKVVTTYDALGRAKQVSNPYRPSLGESAVYLETAYDLLGRVSTVTAPDSSVVSTTYVANTVTVTDQAQKKRKTVTDALGRLIEVYEDPDGFNYLTSYQYDTLDNLTGVTQGTQTRSFVYNSLKQLLSATNPESGTISYQYDDGANLLVKTDARGVSAHYSYDAFSRVVRRWYNGSSSLAATTHNSPALPAAVGTSNEAKFFYDAQSLPSGAPSFSRGASNGRLVAATYGTNSSAGDYTGYDSAGRNVLKIQQTGVVNYWISAALNVSGAPSSVVYPSGRSVNYTYNVAGRTTGVVGDLGDGATRTYATDLQYSAMGGLTKEKFGTNSFVYHKLHYNDRGQMCDVRASNVDDEWGGELGALVNYYSTNWVHCGSGPDNNGNVLRSQTIINSYYMEDRYSYDALNRLTAVDEHQNGNTHTGSQQYDYDRYGNRLIKPASWGTGINSRQFTRSDVNNRLDVPAGQSGLMNYDAAGNLTNDTYTGAGNRTYDAESKITSAWGGNNQAQLYTYDANGQRIRRTVDGADTWQIYGLGGELLAEYAANGAAMSPQKEYGYRNGQLLITATPGGDQSLGLNGSSAYVQAPNSTSLNITGAITVEAWIKPNAIGSYQYIASRETYGVAGTGGGYELTLNNLGKARFDLYHSHNTYTPVIGNTVLTTGVWHHIAGVWDGTQMRLYVNGVLDATVTTGNGPASGTSSVKVGRNSGGGYFNGLIDEVRVSNAAVYTSNFTPQTHLSAGGSTKGLWKFDGSTASDSSGNSNHGALQSGATYSSDVPTGPAYHSGSFNGSAYVQVPNSTSLNITGAITVEAWIKPNAIGSYQYIASRETYGVAGTGGGYELTLNNLGKARFDLYHSHNTYTPVIGNTVLTTAVWHHIAGVWDGTQMRLYVNGVLDATVTTGNGPASGTSSVKLGRNSGGGYFNGLIDEVRVSNAAVYTSSFTPETHLSAGGSTKGLWNFDGQSTADASGNSNHGTLQGGAAYSNDVPSGDGGGGASSAPQINWLVTDHLGTPRMIIDQTGTLANIKRHDYLPFGEELFAPAGGRTTGLGYSGGDGVRQQFTQKERDVETGLDFFEARYFGSMQGRFTSVDPYNPIVDAEDKDEFNEYLGQPQNWNRYVYVWNNPLRYIDPFGEKVYVVTYTYGNSEGDDEFKRAAETKAQQIRNSKGFDAKKDTVLVRGVYKKEDFAAVLKEANSLQKQFGKVEQVVLYSHAGANDGPVFHDRNGNPSQFSQRGLSSLRVNWSNSAIAQFYGCYTSPNFARNFANAQRVPTYGYDKFAYFSNRQDKMVPDEGGGRPLYLIAADYGTANGVDAAIRYQLGRGRVYPMMRHDPPVRRRPRR